MCLKNGFIISGTEKYENPIFIYVLIICDSPNTVSYTHLRAHET